MNHILGVFFFDKFEEELLLHGYVVFRFFFQILITSKGVVTEFESAAIYISEEILLFSPQLEIARAVEQYRAGAGSFNTAQE